MNIVHTFVQRSCYSKKISFITHFLILNANHYKKICKFLVFSYNVFILMFIVLNMIACRLLVFYGNIFFDCEHSTSLEIS